MHICVAKRPLNRITEANGAFSFVNNIIPGLAKYGKSTQGHPTGKGHDFDRHSERFCKGKKVQSIIPTVFTVF
jgi:hypothetical protein